MKSMCELSGIEKRRLSREEIDETNKNDKFDWLRAEEIERLKFESAHKNLKSVPRETIKGKG